MLFATAVARDVVPLGKEYHVDNDGFRSDFAAPEQRPLAESAPTASLAILGEPGVGKSRALSDLTAHDTNTVMSIPLETVGDLQELKDRLEAVHTAVAAGLDPDHLTLVLDSIDECPIPTKSLLFHLEATLKRLHGPRVVLACRTADWPESFTGSLRSLLPDFEVLELLPLRRADIATLATSRGVDAHDFLAAVVGAAAVPLAILPLTLDLLLVTYQQGGRLPDSAAELYEQGLLRLVEDPDPDRAPGKKPAGSAPQRLAVAARLAAYTMLCGRSAIARAAPALRDDLLAGVLAAGVEPIDGGDLTVTNELVNATLSTALFAGRGAGRFAVVHASFAAYLTARYLTTHAVAEHQLRALLTRTNSLGRTRVPPRLRETAAWVVALEPHLNEWLVDADPDTLAAHAGLVNVPTVRQALVAYLLDASEPELRTSRRRWRLGHPGLAEQLRPALRAPLTEDAGPHFGHPVSRRARVAVEIARYAGGPGSVSDLADLLLSRTTNSYLRTAAAYALNDLDAATGARTLLSVLDEVIAHPDHDPDDELRGLAMEANWPENLTAPGLVKALAHPQRSNFIGSYALFLTRFLDDVDDKVITDLVRAITPPPGGPDSGERDEWVDEDDLPRGPGRARLLATFTDTRRSAQVMTALLTRALGSTQLDVIVNEVGWLLAMAARHHHQLAIPARFDDPDDPDDSEGRQLRRALVLAALRNLPADHAGLLPLRARGGATPGLLTAADLEWLFSLGETDLAPHAARLIRFVADNTNQRHQALAWAHRDDRIFRESVAHWFDAVDLDSPEAEQMREEHRWSARAEQTWDGAVTHEQALHVARARCERGDPDGLLELCSRLRVNPQTGHITNDDDLRTWPSYPLLALDDASLEAFVERYLRSTSMVDETWFDEAGTLPFHAFVGYVALAYLARCPDGNARLDALPPQVWRRWTPAILRVFAGLGDPTMKANLRQKARHVVPETYLEWTLRAIEVDARGQRSLDHLDDVTADYAESVGDRLDAVLRGVVDTIASTVATLNRLTEPSDLAAPRLSSRSDLGGTLFTACENGSRLGRFLAPRRQQTQAWLRELAEGVTTGPVDARVLATEVLLSRDLLPWEKVLAAMQDDEGFAVALAVTLARERGDDAVLPKMTGHQLTDLWSWLDVRWSSQTDTLTDGYVTDDQTLRDWRNAIVAELQARATPDALAALARLVTSRADDYRLQAALAEAETRDHDENWRGVTVKELTALLTNARRTLVNDDDALFRAVLSSLERFADRMRDIGQTLWNESRPASSEVGGPKGRVWNPKYEPAVSAALRDHLAQEFGEQLVVNREVLVKQTTSKGHGLSVDVLPTATEAASGRRLPNCPIEVKCCWNPELLTGLQAQLVADYLPATGATRGIYVCAWFPIGQWDDHDDPRFQQAAARDRDHVVRYLTDAAQSASESGRVEVAAVVIEIPRPTPSSRAGRRTSL